MGNLSSKTTIFYMLPVAVAEIRDLTSGAKCLFAKLIFDAWGGNCSRVGAKRQAKAFGIRKQTIQHWLRELERRDLVKITYEQSSCCYYLSRKFREGASIPLLVEVLKRRDVGWSYKLVLCSLAYGQGENDWCWPMQKALAADLGLSLWTIQRLLAAMKTKYEVQIRLRRRNPKQGNKYVLTCGAVSGGKIYGSNPHTAKTSPLYKKRNAKSYSKQERQKILSRGLSEKSPPDSFGSEEVLLMLKRCRVHEKVAQPMAFEQLHPFESVVQAINNAEILRAVVWKRATDAGLPRPKFNVPGYVVAALNAARREGRIIGTTMLFREAGRKSRELRLAKAGRANREPLIGRQFERRRRKLIRQLGLPA